MLRLRQIVLVARDLEGVAGRLRSELGLGEPYADPGVAEFGVRNAVMALGDTFVEVISPVRERSAAARFLERRGDGGYMVIVQVDEIDRARRRVADLGVRVVWRIDLSDIAGTHLHPKDVRGAILSLDAAVPPGSWRWAGPAWTRRAPAAQPGRVLGVTIQSPEPDLLATTWARVLGVQASGNRVLLDGEQARFIAPIDGRGEGIVGFDVALAPAVRRGRTEVEVGGALFSLVHAETDQAAAPAAGAQPAPARTAEVDR